MSSTFTVSKQSMDFKGFGVARVVVAVVMLIGSFSSSVFVF
jgi:hypothetical protein